jgi:surface polysaccharide O-acyltransferase-like enzyme
MSDTTSTTAVPTAAVPTRPASAERDLSLDVFRALAMFVVVAWHWVFTILRWRDDGPHVDNPISELPHLGYLTWVLQVMPLFFLVGGALTARSTTKLAGTGERLAWVGRRAKRLLGPAIPLVALLGSLYAAALIAGEPAVARAIFLTATPLWFLLSYFVVTALLPLWGGAARRWPVGHVLVLAAWCVAWDVLRFTVGLEGPVTWLSYVWIWLTVHQAGSLLDRFDVRRRAVALLAAAFGVLVLATHLGPYPVPMVGTRTNDVSNMGPPTAVLLALAGVQLALVALSRAWIARTAARHRSRVEVLAAHPMPVYLWHMVGFSVCALALLALGIETPEEPTLAWWLARPFWVAGPLLVAWPLIRRAAGPRRAGPPGAPAPTARVPAPSRSASG